MNDEDIVYLVYRYYNPKEYPDIQNKERNVYYGWTASKSVLQAFKKQRDFNKYNVRKITPEEITPYCDDLLLSDDKMIDFVSVYSTTYSDRISLFLTKDELKEAEIKINKIFDELCRLVDRDNGKLNLLTLYVNLIDEYAIPLEFIGFDPPELKTMFPPADDYRESMDSMWDCDSLMNNAFNYSDESYTYESYSDNGSYHTNYSSTDISIRDKIIYSLESFIKVLKEDM